MQIILNTEANSGVERVVAINCQFLKNAQYSRRDTLEAVRIPMSVRDNVVGQKVCDVFQEIGVDICDRDISTCLHLEDKD